MQFIDTYADILACFPTDNFSIETWVEYSKRISPHLHQKVLNDISKYNFEMDVLPIVKEAIQDKIRLSFIHETFLSVTKDLNANFITCFGESLDVDVILYLGLCSGAGWATSLGNKRVVLLGIEKIIELKWYNEESMFALIAHELGHIWHMEVGGIFNQQNTIKEKYVFQLYSEGIAMYCEQKLCENDHFYHQNKDGWFSWCESHKNEIKREYLFRVKNEISIQDFFGDWCSYQGYSDVGYFLGCEFVKYLISKQNLAQVAKLSNERLFDEFLLFSE